jgi:hypothetical protein
VDCRRGLALLRDEDFVRPVVLFVRPVVLRARLRLVPPRVLPLVLPERLPERPLDVDRLARDWDFLLAIRSLSSRVLGMGTRTARGKTACKTELRGKQVKKAGKQFKKTSRYRDVHVQWGAAARLRAQDRAGTRRAHEAIEDLRNDATSAAAGVR